MSFRTVVRRLLVPSGGAVRREPVARGSVLAVLVFLAAGAGAPRQRMVAPRLPRSASRTASPRGRKCGGSRPRQRLSGVGVLDEPGNAVAGQPLDRSCSRGRARPATCPVSRDGSTIRDGSAATGRPWRRSSRQSSALGGRGPAAAGVAPRRRHRGVLPVHRRRRRRRARGLIAVDVGAEGLAPAAGRLRCSRARSRRAAAQDARARRAPDVHESPGSCWRSSTALAAFAAIAWRGAASRDPGEPRTLVVVRRELHRNSARPGRQPADAAVGPRDRFGVPLVVVMGAYLSATWLGWYLAVSLGFSGHNNEAGAAARCDEFRSSSGSASSRIELPVTSSALGGPKSVDGRVVVRTWLIDVCGRPEPHRYRRYGYQHCASCRQRRGTRAE